MENLYSILCEAKIEETLSSGLAIVRLKFNPKTMETSTVTIPLEGFAFGHPASLYVYVGFDLDPQTLCAYYKGPQAPHIRTKIRAELRKRFLRANNLPVLQEINSLSFFPGN